MHTLCHIEYKNMPEGDFHSIIMMMMMLECTTQAMFNSRSLDFDTIETHMENNQTANKLKV